jgi:hypothetical protein
MSNIIRSERAKVVFTGEDKYLTSEFVLQDPPLRYMSTETDEVGIIVQIEQADTLHQMAKLLERSDGQGTDTEIHDLDTGDVLRPDFEKIFRIPRIYMGDMIAYQSAAEIRRLGGISEHESDTNPTNI